MEPVCVTRAGLMHLVYSHPKLAAYTLLYLRCQKEVFDTKTEFFVRKSSSILTTFMTLLTAWTGVKCLMVYRPGCRNTAPTPPPLFPQMTPSWQTSTWGEKHSRWGGGRSLLLCPMGLSQYNKHVCVRDEAFTFGRCPWTVWRLPVGLFSGESDSWRTILSTPCSWSEAWTVSPTHTRACGLYVKQHGVHIKDGTDSKLKVME